MEHTLKVQQPPFAVKKKNDSIYKNQPRALTHKPVSVSNETHSQLIAIQLELQYKEKRKVSLDEVISRILTGAAKHKVSEGST